jgi:hypothetical protein
MEFKTWNANFEVKVRRPRSTAALRRSLTCMDEILLGADGRTYGCEPVVVVAQICTDDPEKALL